MVAIDLCDDYRCNAGMESLLIPCRQTHPSYQALADAPSPNSPKGIQINGSAP